MKKIFLAGSVREHIPEKYIKEGEILADYMIQSPYSIICCADNRGIIGKVYYKMKQKDMNRIILTVPKVYEKYTKEIDQKIDFVTNTINERTDKAIQESQICLALPGGIGTIYEVLSMIETKRAGEHQNEILIVNSYGFFDDLLNLLEKVYQEKFAEIETKKEYYVVPNIQGAIKFLKEKEN